MAKQAKAAMGTKKLTALADRGYFKGEEILACKEEDIAAYVPKSLTSNNTAKGLFDKRDFQYFAKDDEYLCPAGERAIWRFAREEKGLLIHRYWSSACPDCPIKAKCTTSKNRKISRWEYEDVLEEMQDGLDRDPEKMRTRRSIVEHPFGTLKAWMGATHFLTRTMDRVSTEMSLHVLAYNMKPVINIVGIQPLLLAIWP